LKNRFRNLNPGPYYSHTQGHVYTRIDDFYFDINGVLMNEEIIYELENNNMMDDHKLYIEAFSWVKRSDLILCRKF
jgi:hypothetical protein